MALFIVTTTSASGSGSLAEAITLAANNAGHDDIVFAATLTDATIALTGTLTLSQDLTIDGDLDNNGFADITLSGGDAHRIMTVQVGAKVVLDGVIMADGHDAPASAPGVYQAPAASAILNAGTLTIVNSSFIGNVASGAAGTDASASYGGYGGNAATIYNTGSLTMTRTSFVNNQATGGDGGTGGPGYTDPGGGIAGGPGYAGGRGGNAASAVLNAGNATLSLLSLGSSNTAAGGAGGSGGVGGTGGTGLNGGAGGQGGHGGDAAAVLGTAYSYTYTTLASPSTGVTGGAAGLGGGAGAGGAGGAPGAAGAPGLAGSGQQTIAQVNASWGAYSVHVVTTADESGPGSLRAAIAGAGAGDVITFSSSLFGTPIVLTTDLDIARTVTIDGDINGDGEADVTISGGHSTRIFDISGSYVYVTLRSLTLTDGFESLGGAIQTGNGTYLNVINSTIAGNTATKGGGIFVGGALNLHNSTFYGNEGSSLGGGLYVAGGHAIAASNLTMTGNASQYGGAIATGSSSNISLRNSTIAGNTATHSGGGLYLSDGSTAVAYNSVIAANLGGGVHDIFAGDYGASSALIARSSFLGGISSSSSLGTTFTNTTVGASADPLLSALDDFGGPVKTMMPLIGSPLINAGSETIRLTDPEDLDHDGVKNEKLPVDARGANRVVGGQIDIGAVETFAFDRTNSGDAVVEDTDLAASGNVLTGDDLLAVVRGVRSGPDDTGVAFERAPATVEGTYGQLQLKANGEWVYVLNNSSAAVQGLAGGSTAVDTFTYVVQDLTGPSSLAELKVSISGSGDAPVITSNGGGATASKSVAENTVTVTTVTSTDADIGATKTFSISGGADSGKFSINASTGLLTFKSAPDFEAPTDAGGNNVYDVVVKVSDGSLTDTQAIAVTVTNVNEAPVITSFSGAATAALSNAEGSIPFPTGFAIFSATDPDGTTPTWSLSGTDADLFTIHSSGALSFVARPDFEAPTDANHDGIYEVTVTASDGSASDTQALSVTITNTVGNTIAGTKKADTIDGTHGRSGKFATGEEDTINGKAGNDTIKALGGNDTVKGGTGVDDLDGGDGIDAVDFSDMTLGVELTLKGSKQAIAKVGGVADDKLKNFESILGGKAGDTLTGDGKANLLSGNAGNDSLNGGKGIDTLKGGLGADTLTGGKGATLDIFLFDAKLGSGNIDVVTDFKHGIDKLALDDAIFAAIGPTLETGELFSKSGAVKAKQLDDRLIYDTKTGNLFYDADGKGGAAAIHFATILDGGKPAVLDTTDILIV